MDEPQHGAALAVKHEPPTEAQANYDLTKERERREQAEADALRAGVRRDTLEQVLAQLRPDQTPGSVGKKKSATR